MSELPLQLLIGTLTLLPCVAAYWVARLISRRKTAALFRLPRPWQDQTLQGWADLGCLDPDGAGTLPAELVPAVVFYEWAGADPDAAQYWRFREPLNEKTPVEAMVRDAWSAMPDAARTRGRERLAAALAASASWWGGAERGWNGRPFVLLPGAISRKQAALPLLPLEDLTAAPLPMPLRGERLPAGPDQAEAVDLVLALAALRRSACGFMHPLAPGADSKESLVAGLSQQVGTDVGRRIGAGLGAVLGPIGSMVGQYLGARAGALGGKALAQQALPTAISGALQETEGALAELGGLVETDDFVRAASQPAETILERGKHLEIRRQDRSRGLRERLWPTPGQVMIEAALQVAVGELKAYRGAAEHFVQTARKSPRAVVGGMLLQNPWMVRVLPGGADRLNAARAALNRAAHALRSGE